MKPWLHQQIELEQHAATEGRCIFWEQGTGKTKIVLDTFVQQLQAGAVTGLVVVAPPNVERNWIKVEAPKHIPAPILAGLTMHAWSTARKGRKDHKESVAKLLKAEGPVVLAISYDALLTKDGAELVKALLVERPCMFIADESARIKNPKALRTKTMLKASKLAYQRRPLSGTPITSKPFDVYTQVMFADDGFWKSKGIGSYFAFRNRFGVWRQRMLAGGRSFQELVQYRDLDTLQTWLAEIATRVEKKDALDLPPKIYKRQIFAMSAKQAAFYEQMKNDFAVQMSKETEAVTAELAIVRMLRLQQIACGYLPVATEDGETEMVQIDTENQRLQTLLELVEDYDGKAIIWARFRSDIDQLEKALTDVYGADAVVRMDGSTKEAQREVAVERFQNGTARFFIANAATAGEGLTLHAAKLVIYYSQAFKLGERLQSEDRAHRGGMSEEPVVYVDMEAEDTIDAHITANLLAKKEVSARVLGAELKAWLTTQPLIL